MDTPWTIHVLGADDVQLLRGLVGVFAAAFDDEAEAPAPAGRSDDALRSLLAGEVFVAVAALRGHEVIGGLTGYVLPRPDRVAPEFYLYDLAVAKSHRRRGIATALIDRGARVARARGARGMYVQAHPADEGAVALYDTLGTRTEVLHFDIPTVRAATPE